MSVEDLANVLNLRKEMVLKLIGEKDIRVHKVSGRLSSRWIVDLEDFWLKV
jgi:excisionase family DNA binding protein